MNTRTGCWRRNPHKPFEFHALLVEYSSTYLAETPPLSLLAESANNNADNHYRANARVVCPFPQLSDQRACSWPRRYVTWIQKSASNVLTTNLHCAAPCNKRVQIVMTLSLCMRVLSCLTRGIYDWPAIWSDTLLCGFKERPEIRQPSPIYGVVGQKTAQ